MIAGAATGRSGITYPTSGVAQVGDFHPGIASIGYEDLGLADRPDGVPVGSADDLGAAVTFLPGPTRPGGPGDGD